jgi:hypothetical protein
MVKDQKQDDLGRWGVDKSTRQRHCFIIILVVIFLILFFCFRIFKQQPCPKNNQSTTTQKGELS